MQHAVLPKGLSATGQLDNAPALAAQEQLFNSDDVRMFETP
jgi:hypothetical protein